MRTFFVKVLVNALALWLATLVVPGVHVAGAGSLGNEVLTFLLVGAIFGLVNAFVKPLVNLLALPFYILTLGLITFVINALMLELSAWLSSFTSLTLTIDHFFWDAILAALVVSFVSLVLHAVLPDGKRRR